MSVTGQLEFTSSSTSSTFIWKIENFSKTCSEVGEFIVSPIFESGDCNNKTHPKWKLKLYPFGHSEECKDYVSVFLSFISQPMLEKYVGSFAISIQDGTQIDMRTRFLSPIDKFITDYSTGWEKLMHRSKLFAKETSLLKQGTLIILCCISNTSLKTMCHCISPLRDKYESIYLSKDFSDAAIVINNKKINIHKAILSASSTVFSAMFENDMAEAKTNLITISDIEYTVMEKFLLFLYSGKVDDIDKFATALLPVAEKYDVYDLKLLCENSLWDTITVDNACEILSIADLYNCDNLRMVSIDFITSHIKKIIKTKDFENLSNSKPAIFKEIFYNVVKKKLL